MNDIFNSYLHIVASPPADSLLYFGTYSPGLVVLSVGIAVFAAYTALLVADFSERAENAHIRQILLTLGGLALGAGIWSMHFVGMLGFALPCGVSYNPWVTAFSMIPGILASIFSLRLISQPQIDWKQLVIGGTLFGAGVGVMHYAGMAAMRMDALLRYDIWLFLLSIVVAVVLAILSLWIRTGIVKLFPSIEGNALVVSAIVMGGAVSGMHYTAMAAAYFVREGDVAATHAGFEPLMLAIVIAGVTGLLIGVVQIYVFRHVLRTMELSSARASESLARLESLVREQDNSVWIKSRSAEVLDALRGEESAPEFARKLMARLAPMVNAQVGVFYYFDLKTKGYSLLGSYGYRERKGFVRHFALGEGIVGQCVLERAPITLSEVPPDYIYIRSGLGTGAPRYVHAAPMILPGGEIPAVIELATLTVFGSRESQLLTELLPMIALNLEILERNQRTRVLLEDSRIQQQLMARQTEELRAVEVALMAQKNDLLSSAVVDVSLAGR
jgi:NO-binding membrane sensor protein with MHYT domain